MAFYFKNTKKDIIMAEKDEEDYRNDNYCRFCEKHIEFDKVRDRCHLANKYRYPAFKTCNLNVTQKQSNVIPFIFHSFSNIVCLMFFEIWLIKK